MSRFRIGAVSYLNSKPLIYGLSDRSDCELNLNVPSRLADGLQAGQFDVGLVPIVALFEHPDWVVVSDACIACCGPVWSVKLCSNVPVDQIRTLGLDEGSRTSALLVRILLQRRYGLIPECGVLPIGADWQSPSTDAVLVIGDRAIQNPPRFPHVWDLGEEWHCQFGSPFVFAVWAARPGPGLTALGEILNGARDLGVAHLEEIAAAAAGQHGADAQRCLDYLRDNLHFHLDHGELEGLNRFYRLAVEAELAEPGWVLNRHDCAVIG